MRWMILGASPSAPDYHRVPDVDVVASAGDAILLRRPDFFFVVEEESMFRYEKERAFARLLGTKVVIKEDLLGDFMERARKKGVINYEYKYPYDEAIPCIGKMAFERSWKRWKPGRYVASCAGLLAMQYAVNHNACEIHMIGMQGYSDGIDYFNGRRGTKGGARYTRVAYEPLVKKIISLSPNVTFIQYGKPLYRVGGPNYFIRN